MFDENSQFIERLAMTEVLLWHLKAKKIKGNIKAEKQYRAFISKQIYFGEINF